MYGSPFAFAACVLQSDLVSYHYYDGVCETEGAPQVKGKYTGYLIGYVDDGKFIAVAAANRQGQPEATSVVPSCSTSKVVSIATLDALSFAGNELTSEASSGASLSISAIMISSVTGRRHPTSARSLCLAQSGRACPDGPHP